MRRQQVLQPLGLCEQRLLCSSVKSHNETLIGAAMLHGLQPGESSRGKVGCSRKAVAETLAQKHGEYNNWPRVTRIVDHKHSQRS